MAAPVTRGFLFADLRGYTAYTESHGDAAASRLLDAYRQLVRGVVDRYAGAEVRTEGDSFYVVFPSATAAVLCAIGIVDAATQASLEQPGLPINVGIGVHAGETADNSEGYVGSAVNLAARLGSAASAGEVLVSETVRGLTRTGGEIRYVARGQRRLKGIAEPILTFSATTAGTAPTVTVPLRSRMTGLRAASVALGASAVIIAAVVLASRLIPGQPSPSPGPSATPAAVAGSSPTPMPTPVATPSRTPTPTTTSEFAEMPFGEPVAPAGRYSLRQFYLSPDLETDGGWRLGTCRGPARPCVYDINAGYDRGLVELHRADRPQSELVLFHPTELLSDPCATGPVATLAPGYSFLDWLRMQPALETTGEVQRVFTNVQAVQFYVTVLKEPEASAPMASGTPCPYTTVPSVAMRSYGSFTGFALNRGDVDRVYAITVPSNVYAFLIAPTAEEFDLIEPPAEAVLNALHFPTP